MTKGILLSTDIGSDIDDALSLLVMLNHPGINLSGIYTVNGDVASRSYIAKHIVNLIDKKIPVIRGESESINNFVLPYSHFEGCLVDPSFVDEEESELSLDLVYKSLEASGIITTGIEHLAETLSRKPSVVFNIGPATNLARLIEQHPQVLKNIEKVYFMGCRFSQEIRLEHNVNYDPLAAKILFDSELPIVVVPAELCSKYRLPTEQISQIKSPAGKYVQKMAKAFLAVQVAKEIASENIQSERLENILLSNNYLRSISTKKSPFDLLSERKRLFINLDDPIFGALEPEMFFDQFNGLIHHLRNPDNGYNFGRILADSLAKFMPKDISIADIYVPYCFLHPEKITTIKKTVKINPATKESISLRGKKHEIVVDLDFKHFKSFLERYLK